MITVDSILTELSESAKEGQIFSPHLYLEKAGLLNALIGEESDKYYLLRQEVSKLIAVNVENGDSVAKAKMKSEASDLYRLMKQQESKLEQVQEAIRIAKKFSTLKSEEMRNNL
jgi:hypothetical protein